MTTDTRYPGFDFTIQHQDTQTGARAGILRTPHGEIETPNFIFCATKAAIKGASIDDLKKIGAAIILSNTYHLMLRPGPDLVREMGGLHRFMGWDGPMLTDSGGFQIFSLGHGSVADEIKGRQSRQSNSLKHISEAGATFKSYIDGSTHHLSPELSIQIQRKLGADLIVVLDECTPYHVSKAYTEQSMHLSHRWADRCLTEFFNGSEYNPQALVGIVQGGVYPDLRKVAGEFISSRPFFYHAIGGSLGSSKAQMYEVVGYAQASLDNSKPVHLLGIGGVDDVWRNTAQGIDTFDCVMPTRIARHGWALVRDAADYKLNLKNSRFRHDPEPISDDCDCPVCQQHTRAYLHYLIKANELLYINLLTVHNMRFMMNLMHTIRQHIKQGTFTAEMRRWLH